MAAAQQAAQIQGCMLPRGLSLTPYLCCVVYAPRSPLLTRVSYTVSSRAALDEALTALSTLQHLRHLELVVKNFTLCSDQLRVIGT